MATSSGSRPSPGKLRAPNPRRLHPTTAGSADLPVSEGSGHKARPNVPPRATPVEALSAKSQTSPVSSRRPRVSIHPASSRVSHASVAASLEEYSRRFHPSVWPAGNASISLRAWPLQFPPCADTPDGARFSVGSFAEFPRSNRRKSPGPLLDSAAASASGPPARETPDGVKKHLAAWPCLDHNI